MCGITGFWTPTQPPPEPEARRLAEAMADALRHRGPDHGATWTDPEAGVALGFRRLAILDLSPLGHQPMASSDGRFIIVFNGEIYNFRELREELEASGATFRGRSDTEVLLAAVGRWGLDATIRRLVGMFAFALWDRERHELHLVRDRIGKKPLYYVQAGSTFLFGSELKSLRRHPAFPSGIDHDALARFLRHLYIPSPHTIHVGVRKLPPAHRLTVTATRGKPLRPEPYWSLADASAPARRRKDLTDAHGVEGLERLLDDAVRSRAFADVPMGAFLSGGIDSSMVVALLQRNQAQPVRTFTIGFYETPYDEARHARAVAEHLGTQHTEHYVTPQETLAVLPKLSTVFDEPFADPSQIPTYLVSQLARRHVKVALSGDGGDELFGGYPWYARYTRGYARVRRVPRWLRGFASRRILSLGEHAWDGAYRAAAWTSPRRRNARAGHRIHRAARLWSAASPDDYYAAAQDHWPQPTEIVPGADRRTRHEVHPADSTPGLTPTERFMFLDQVGYLPEDVLVKVDRASMALGLEVRCPILDHRVIEYAWGLPLRFKLRGGVGKWALRQVLYRHVPRTLVDRPKKGFAVPIDDWLRGPLRDWADSLLDERRLREQGYLSPEPIRTRWREHIDQGRNWGDLLWAVLMFQAWLDANESAAHRWVESAAAALRVAPANANQPRLIVPAFPPREVQT